MTWWWLSFANDDGPLGAAFVQAPSFVAAAAKARVGGYNPGGEVAGWPMPAEVGAPPARWRHRLLRDAEVNEAALAWTGIGSHVAELDETTNPRVLDQHDNEGS